jgi:exo-1,4-beta-D-glucosaminidase
VANQVYKDLYVGQALSKVPVDQFDVPWTFSSSFQVSTAGPMVIQLQGLSYRGSVLINGEHIASLEGTFVYHELSFAAKAGSNTVEVIVERGRDDVFPPGNNSTDLDITFIDWSPTPPDHSMGLIRPVRIASCLGEILQYPVLNSTISGSDALISISVEVFNCDTKAARNVGRLSASLAGVKVSVDPFLLGPGERRLLTFPTFLVANAPLWWPHTHGTPQLTMLNISNAEKTLVSEMVGIRQIASGVDAATQTRWYSINGQHIDVVGAGWANELLLQRQEEWATTFLQLAKHVGLNMIRLEGQLLNDEIFEEADRLGLLVVPGISCCDAWQHWPSWTEHTLDVARASVRSQVKRTRQHPCILAFWYSSDELPPVNVESAYLEVFKDERWPNPTLNSAANWTSPLSGPSGVKMSGPYQWVPPVFWLEALQHPTTLLRGGAFGFLTEGGKGFFL